MELKGRDRIASEKLDSRDIRNRNQRQEILVLRMQLQVCISKEFQEHTIQIKPNGRMDKQTSSRIERKKLNERIYTEARLVRKEQEY